MYTTHRGSIPAKVEYWEGLRIFSYVPTPTKLTKKNSKTQLLDPKRGGSRQKYPKCAHFLFLACFSGF